jgi:hypothetical protein
MSKATGNPDIVLVFSDSYISHIEGKLLTVIEALGLPKAQEEATKSLVRRSLWDSLHDGYSVPKPIEAWQKFSRTEGTFESIAV